jgi:hypothetical protein
MFSRHGMAGISASATRVFEICLSLVLLKPVCLIQLAAFLKNIPVAPAVSSILPIAY